MKYTTPKLAEDVLHKVIDVGIPAERFANGQTYLHFYKEKEILPRTSEFMPTRRADQYFTVLRSQRLDEYTIDILDFNKIDRAKYVQQAYKDAMKFELGDPLKGNTIASTTIHDYKMYLLCAGPTLSHLAVCLTNVKQFTVRPNYSVEMPFDSVEVAQIIDLKRPIRQIAISPIKTTTNVVVMVRTTSSILVVLIDDSGNIRVKNELFLPDESETNSDIDYSMPIHVEPSPYSLYQYLFITNNGYVSIRDADTGEVIFEAIDPLPEGLTYELRWKSCGFGVSVSTLYIASPDSIQLWEINKDTIETKTLATSKNPISCFATSKCRSLFCFSTEKSVVLFDCLVPTEPIITCKHRFSRGNPSILSIEKLENNEWRLYIFAHSSQQLAFVDFEYVNTPSAVSPKRTVTIKRFIEALELPQLDFGRAGKMPLYITSTGMQVNILDQSNDREFISIERQFEDGSFRTLYLELNKEKLNNDEMTLETEPNYKLTYHEDFQELLDDQILFKIPRLGKPNTAEIRHVFLNDMESFLNNIYEYTDSQPLPNKVKAKAASIARKLEYPVTFNELFEKDSYLPYRLEDLEEFLLELEQFENIEITRQIHIPPIMRTECLYPEFTDKLLEAHDKKMQLMNSIIRPKPSTLIGRKKTNPMKYLCREKIIYASTTTTKVCANLWPLNTTTSYKDLEFPEIDTTIVPPIEDFQGVSRREATPSYVSTAPPIIEIEEDNSLPIVVETSTSRSRHKVSSQDASSLKVPDTDKSFTDISTQPVPGAFGSRSKSVSKKKKKSKTSGFK